MATRHRWNCLLTATWAGVFVIVVASYGQAQDSALEAAPAPVPADGTAPRPDDDPTDDAMDVRPNQRSLTSDAVLLPSGHLFGDWYGLRSRLEAQGITPSVTWVTNMAGNPVGGREQAFTEAENLGIDFAFDLQKLYQLDDTQFHVSMSQRSGVGLSQNYIGNVFPVQQVSGGETFKLVDVDLQHTFADGDCEVRLGRIAVTDDFLVSPYFWLFMNNGIDGSPKGIFLNAPGTTAYPNTTWGARLRRRIGDRAYVMAGTYNADSSAWQDSDHGLDWSLHGPLYAVAEAGYVRNGMPSDEGLLGTYKVGVYYNGGSFTNSAGRVLGSTASSYGLTAATTQGNWGFYTLFDQVIYRFGIRSEQRGAGVFGSLLVAPDDTINEMPLFCNGGVIVRGLLPRRPTDSLGCAVVFGKFSSDLAAVQQLAQTVDPTVGVQDCEVALEWFYRIRLRDGAAFVQPDLQYILNPGGTHQDPNALVVGLQAGINF
jgi:porin